MNQTLHSAARRIDRSTTHGRLIATSISASIGLWGCASQPTSHSHSSPSNGAVAQPTDAASADSWIRTELYFGLSIPPGSDGSPASTVSDAQWRQFVDQEISPRFPDGLTVLQATGQWRSRPTDGHPVEIVHEDSRVVVIFHHGPAPARSGSNAPADSDEAKIEQIRAAYKARFRQDSVMRTNSVLRVDF